MVIDYMKSGPLLNAMPPIFGKEKMTTFQPSFLFWKLNYFSRDFDEWGQSKSIVHLYSGSSSEINQEKMKAEEDAEYRICRLDVTTYIYSTNQKWNPFFFKMRLALILLCTFVTITGRCNFVGTHNLSMTKYVLCRTCTL